MAFDATVAESVTPDNRSELMASRQLRNSLLLFSVSLALNSLGQIRSRYKTTLKKVLIRIHVTLPDERVLWCVMRLMVML